MLGNPKVAVQALNQRYLRELPGEAARRLEQIAATEAAAVLADQPVEIAAPVIERIAPDTCAALLAALPDDAVGPLLAAIHPTRAVALLVQYDEPKRSQLLSRLKKSVAKELRDLMDYPENTAGRLMNPQITVFRGAMKVADALGHLRRFKRRFIHTLFIVDDNNLLTGQLNMRDLALAAPDETLKDLSAPVNTFVTLEAPREEIVAALQRTARPDLPVVDFAGRFVGVIEHASLVEAVAEEATVDIQTMVGASKDERALSAVSFVVKKRLPWLQINLLTAFLAASVVGAFESTIAKYTALAVLLPVVAGQSGNTGAQALAVTMRGLALREITVRQWLPVVIKEINAGFLNGVAIALTTGAAVLIWSGSWGLAAVILLSMIISMVLAGFSGAIVPIFLKRLGQDPAQSSSIVLTTITDVAGFMSFLGIATLLAGFLTAASP